MTCGATEAMIATQAERFVRWLEGRTVVPTITALQGSSGETLAKKFGVPEGTIVHTGYKTKEEADKQLLRLTHSVWHLHRIQIIATDLLTVIWC